MNRALPRGRLVGEFFLIVIGVLAALMFDYYGFDESQQQFRPLQFETEHRHFELAAGVLSLDQELYYQNKWTCFVPDTYAAAKNDAGDVTGILDAAKRLQSRPDLIAWLPQIRHLQLEQIDVHKMRLDRAMAALKTLQNYAARI